MAIMAIRLRRSHHEARFELTPLLDVIFLLLTFFIYSQVLLIRPYILPVALPQVTAGRTAEPAKVWGVTLDRTGELYLNEKPTSFAALEQRLAEIADRPADQQPRIYVAVEDIPPGDSAPVDRGPMLIKLMDKLRAQGIDEYGLVVKPATDAASPSDAGAAAPPAAPDARPTGGS